MRVSVLTSGEATRGDDAFEHYVFDYRSESITGVISSCRPEALIFTGGVDAYLFNDGENRNEALHNYIAGLGNLLICAGKQGVRHFISLSTESVFEDQYMVNITEEASPSPTGYKQMVMYQGETLALAYNGVSTMEVTVVRLGNLYTVPDNADECNNLICDMCLKAIRNEVLHVNSKSISSALFSGDAIEGLYRLMIAPTRQYHLYHIASSEYFSELDLANTIQSGSINPVYIEDITTGLTTQRTLSPERFDREFGFSARASYHQTVPAILGAMNQRLGDFQGGGQARADRMSRFMHIIRDAVPYLEAIVCLIICYFLTGVLDDTLPSINLYLLFTLLFAAFYGSRLGIFSAALASVGYCLTQLGGERTGLMLLIDINTYVWIAQVFIVGLIVGNARDQLTQVKQDMREEVDFLGARLKDVTSINESNVQIKNFFEERVVDSDAGVGYVYSIISELDQADSGSVLFAATRILTKFMGTKDVSIYRLQERRYSRVVTSTSVRARSLGKSIVNDEYPELFSEITTKHLYVNSSLDPNLPFMAGAMTDVDGNVNFAVFLWDLSYDHMTMYYCNLLRVICALIGNAVTRSAKYLDAVRNERMLPGTNIMRHSAFMEYIDIYRAAKEEQLAEFSLIYISTDGLPLKEWSDRISKLLRHTDSIGVLDDSTLGVVLTNTDDKEALVVVRRLHGADIPVRIRR